MTTGDIISMSLRNLWRRKGRTLLTVSGVVIGCCAVVIMISMGIGMKQSQDEMLQSMGNLMQITVTPSPSKARNKTLLDKNAVTKIRSIANVKTVVPKKTLDLGDLKLTNGKDCRYVSDYASIVGIPEEELKNAGYELTSGTMPDKDWEVLAGQYTVYNFADSKRPEGKNTVDYWDNEDAKPYFDIVNSTLSISRKIERGSASANDSESGGASNASSAIWKELQKMQVSGVVKENYDVGDETSSGIILTMKDFERLEKIVSRVSGTKAGKEYSQVVVTVCSLDQVAAVENVISAMGFQTSSMESIRKPMEQSVRQKQLMLAGLGAVSLFVAAIGIANTMIMSITERTREIGILKALGCSLGDIRKEFLMEAGFIGLIGGIAGSAISAVIAWLMNTFSGISLSSDTLSYLEEGTSSSGTLCVIPPWLALFAILFSVAMGVGAGFLPANRAVHISALEAMKA